MNLIKALVLVLLLGLNHCSQYPLYRYKISSLEENKLFYRGREIISTDINDVTIIISFEDQVRNELIFNLSIINRSDQIIEIDPSKIFIEIQKTYPPDYYDGEIVVHNSIDPEQKINSLNQQIVSLNSAKQTSDMIYTFISLADIIQDISELSKEKSPDKLYTESVIDHERLQSIASQEINYQNNLSYFMDYKYYWENVVLRKTTLYQDDEISGLVHLPLDENVREFIIVIPVEDGYHEFIYSSRPLIN